MPIGTCDGKSSRVVNLGKRTAVVEVSDPPADLEQAAVAAEASPRFGVAMLKIAMELKKATPGSLEALISGVLARMQLDEAEFRAYLEANGGLLKAIARRRKY
jgi:hypothetical protein